MPATAVLKYFKPLAGANDLFAVGIRRPASADCNSNGVPDAQDIANCLPGSLWCADCNANALPDGCELGANDCNLNAVPDDCDIAAGTAADCDGNGTPDACELLANDCNANGLIDACDVAAGAVDCNANGLPDECDVGFICDNDFCGGALPLCPGTSQSGTTLGANSDGAACADSSITPDTWYVYVPAADGTATIDTCGSLFDTVLSVHGGCPGTMSNVLACNDQFCGNQFLRHLQCPRRQHLPGQNLRLGRRRRRLHRLPHRTRLPRNLCDGRRLQRREPVHRRHLSGRRLRPQRQHPAL